MHSEIDIIIKNLSKAEELLYMEQKRRVRLIHIETIVGVLLIVVELLLFTHSRANLRSNIMPDGSVGVNVRIVNFGGAAPGTAPLMLVEKDHVRFWYGDQNKGVLGAINDTIVIPEKDMLRRIKETYGTKTN